MAGYERVVWNGDAGEVWENKTDRAWYQLLVSWSNTCGLCAQYDRAVSSSSWAIPFHHGCNCRQVVVRAGAKAQPSVDFRELIRNLDPAQRSKCVGASNLRLIEAGVVDWSDVVTPYRVRDLNEVVAIKNLDVGSMLQVGVRRTVAEKAFQSVNTPAHQLVAAKRAQLLANLQGAGLDRAQVREILATGLASRVAATGPSGEQRTRSSRQTTDQLVRLNLATWAAQGPAPPPPPPLLEMRVQGEVAPEAKEAVAEALEALPEDVRRYLHRAKAELVLARRMEDVLSAEHLDRRPRGWPEGSTMRNLDGVFDGRRAIVATHYRSMGSGKERPSKVVAGNALHELGHAVDAAYGRPSRSKGFVAAYAADVARLSDQSRKSLGYFLMEGHAGRSEAWAELTAQVHRRRTVEADLLDAFPEAAQWMRKFLAKPRPVAKSDHVETPS